jgi:Tfp pilus assembly protein PilX
MKSCNPNCWKNRPDKSGWYPFLTPVVSVHQRGLILLLSLAILAGLSLLALLAANSMLQQQQMAANHSDGELARLAAMTAVSAGEKFLFSLPNESRIEGCLSDCFIEPARSRMLRSGIATDQAEFLPDEWWLQWGQSLEPAFD